MAYAKSFFIVAAVFILQAASATVLWAGPATEQVRQTADKVLSVLQDGRLKSADRQNERRQQLRQIIGARFDFAEMAKRSLGPHWQRGNREEQDRFVRLFTGLLERSYTDQIEAYDGEKIVYGRENVSGNLAEVETKVVTKKGEDVSLNYKLRSASGDWKVYDVVIENVSIVNNFRSQFNRIMANASFAELIKRLESKSSEVKRARS